MKPVDQLLRLENFFWAWEKARAAYSFDKTWFDEIALKSFEADLKSQLTGIRADFITGNYKLGQARPIAFPKRGDLIDPSPKTRQMFGFSVRDQVAWVALINVVGPILDRQMPSWSYGDRLYRSVWRAADSEGGTTRAPLQIGPYRHTSRHLYRPFKFAWPRYRKHLYLAVNVMASGPRGLESFSVQDSDLLQDERAIESDRVRVPYLRSEHWREGQKDVYWAGLDLKRFFPSTPVALIEKHLIESLHQFDPTYRGELDGLISSMLEFPISLHGWTESEIAEELGIGKDEREVYKHLPTGLLVAGFLANTSMLEVDRAVSRALRIDEPGAAHDVAHFRYVDDHVLLATNVADLLNWIETYQRILVAENAEWSLNLAKIEPKEVRDFLINDNPDAVEPLRATIAVNHLDARFPRPLLSHTLTKISVIASTRFELLDDIGQAQFIQDLEMLLLGDFGPGEVRPDTRASFASSALARALPHLRQMTTDTWRAIADRQRCQERLQFLSKQREAYKAERLPISIPMEEADLLEQLSKLRRLETLAKASLDKSREKDERRTFELLLNSIARYPDKIRLWQTAVSYCARMGYPGLSSLVSFIADETSLRPITRDYVLAVVTHATAVEMVRAIKRVADQHSAPDDRIAAVRFIASITPELFEGTRGGRWYGPRAWAHLLAAGFAGSTAIRTTLASDLVESEEIVEPVRQSLAAFDENKELGLAAIVKHLSAHNGAKGSLADAALWLEDSLQPFGVAPTSVWSRLRFRIGFADVSARNFHARFPSQFRLSDLSRVATGAIPPLSENDGWYYDSLEGRPPRERKALRELGRLSSRKRRGAAPQIRKALAAQTPPRHLLNLDGWVSWLHGYAKGGENFLERLSDPRLTEWTALYIVDSAAAIVEAIDTGERQPLHPSTILIPKSWTREATTSPGGMSWTDWRMTLDSAPVRLQTDAIDDERYMGPGWRSDFGAPSEWPWVRACGLILLGLLRRSYQWPGLWNPDYSQNSSSYIGRPMISALACSSITSAILESTIMQRPRENVLRRDELPLERYAADTTFDPPMVTTLSELRHWLGRSMKTLAAHQLDGRANRARQLVPLNIRQLTRPTWAEAELPEPED